MNRSFSFLLKAGLLVGTLDIMAACLYFFTKTGKNPLFVLQYIASALVGNDAYSGGNAMLLLGLVLHYLIAFTFTLFLFWIFPKVRAFAANWLVTGILYGAFVWAVMNLAVVPLSRIPDRPFDSTNALINLIILIACVGIPLSYLTNRFYTKSYAGFQAA